MKRLVKLLTILILGISVSCNNDDFQGGNLSDAGHPRILLLKGEEQQIRDLIDSDETWKKMHYAILEESVKIIGKPELERVLIGRRLLSTSRELLKRVYFLSYTYRMTGDEKFLLKAEKELLAVSAFSDWNPSHFLDVAEMTIGVAIGYDWLFEQLPEKSRNTIKNAIVGKGLKPSNESQNNSWLTSKTNWNQVCNAGMVFGALAVQEDFPELAQQIINRAKETIVLPMEAYGPDGVYAEGYNYWGYGTTFNVLLLSALEKAGIMNPSLYEIDGFRQTAQFINFMVTPVLKHFNWSDTSTGAKPFPAMFWFAQHWKDYTILFNEKKFLEKSDYSSFKSNNILPSIMIWGKNIPLEKISAPVGKMWVGQGDNPVAMMRSDWTDKDVYLGFKAGSPSVNHGHMDVGSFVMEANFTRWATDLGMQDYESLESKGMSIFGKTQDAQRWTVFRLNTFSHNVLIFNNQQQRVDGYAKIDRFSDNENFSFAISDISSVYKEQVKKAVRGVAIKNKEYVVVRDEFETLGKKTVVRWNMVTPATVELFDNGANLTVNGKILTIKVSGPSGLEMKTWSTAPTNNYDAANPGTIMVGFECEIPANTKAVFEVLLVPEKEKDMAQFLNKKLDEWN
jgi:hypothetical protein